jgi:hypothetical protein
MGAFAACRHVPEPSIWRVAGVPRREVATSERHGRRPATILLFGCAQSARRRWARSASLTQRWAHARRDVFRELTAEEEAEIKASGTPNDRVGLRPSASAAATAASRCGDETPKAAKPPAAFWAHSYVVCSCVAIVRSSMACTWSSRVWFRWTLAPCEWRTCPREGEPAAILPARRPLGVTSLDPGRRSCRSARVWAVRGSDGRGRGRPPAR